jgi:hypothetical protein
MGGMSSGRWGWHSKRQTVEDSLTLNLSQLAREGSFRAGNSGSVRWLRGEAETGAISFVVRQAEAGLVLDLHYHLKQTGENVTVPIHLETTRPRFGGIRWWGRCPCGRRVARLYLPSGATRFACRQCHELTYESVQQHDKRVDALREHPAALLAILSDAKRNPLNSKLLLALKAAMPKRRR